MNIYNIPLKCGRSPGYAASLNREDRPGGKKKTQFHKKAGIYTGFKSFEIFFIIIKISANN